MRLRPELAFYTALTLVVFSRDVRAQPLPTQKTSQEIAAISPTASHLTILKSTTPSSTVGLSTLITESLALKPECLVGQTSGAVIGHLKSLATGLPIREGLPLPDKMSLSERMAIIDDRAEESRYLSEGANRLLVEDHTLRELTEGTAQLHVTMAQKQLNRIDDLLKRDPNDDSHLRDDAENRLDCHTASAVSLEENAFFRR